MKKSQEKQEPREKREHFSYSFEIATRWSDFDMLQHLNNVQYYRYFECVIMHYLTSIGENLVTDPIVPLTVETSCNFRKPIAVAESVDARIRVTRLGNSSVQYEIGLFEKDNDSPSAFGHFVHVYVDRNTDKPTEIPDWIRSKLKELIVDAD